MSKKRLIVIPFTLFIIVIVSLSLGNMLSSILGVGFALEIFFVFLVGFGCFVGLTALAEKSLKLYGAVLFASLVAAIALNLIVNQHILPRQFIRPNYDEIAQKYVEAVVQDDLTLAYALTDGSENCKGQISESIKRVREDWAEEQGGGWQDQQVGKIDLSITYLIGSPPQETFTIIVWDTQENPMFYTTLRTIYERFGRRYTCG